MTSCKKTLVTIDFDGVVSPIDKSRDFTLTLGWRQVNFGFTCDIHESIIKFLQDLSNLEKNAPLDITWASTWNAATEHFASDSNGLIPDFPWIDVSAGKAEAIFQKVKEGNYTRLVALEDSIKVITKLKKLMKTLPEVEAIYIRPQLTVGLTNTHISKVMEFLEL